MDVHPAENLLWFSIYSREKGHFPAMAKSIGYSIGKQRGGMVTPPVSVPHMKWCSWWAAPTCKGIALRARDILARHMPRRLKERRPMAKSGGRLRHWKSRLLGKND